MRRDRVQLDGIRFVLGVRELIGFVHADKGLVTFVADEGRPYFIPFYVPWQQYNQRVKVYARVGSNTIMELATDDDRLLSDLKEYELDVISNRDKLKDEIELWKMEHIQSYLACCVVLALSGLLCLMSALLGKYILTFISGVILLVSSFVLSEQTEMFNTTCVWDSCGHWVDVESGKTNLAEGCILPDKKEVEAYGDLLRNVQTEVSASSH